MSAIIHGTIYYSKHYIIIIVKEIIIKNRTCLKTADLKCRFQWCPIPNALSVAAHVMISQILPLQNTYNEMYKKFLVSMNLLM